MKHLCCIGHLTNDRIITPSAVYENTGGVAHYFSCAIAHLPSEVDYSLVTKLSESDNHIVQHLRDRGVRVLCSTSKATVFFENIYGENIDERRQRVLAMSDPFVQSDIDNLSADYFHLGTLLPSDFSIPLVAFLKQRGRVSIDAQGFLREVVGEEVKARQWKDKELFLKYIDIIKVNEEELFALTGTNDIARGASQIAEMGPEEVIVTLGSKGSQILYKGEMFTIPAYYTPQVVDSTGCGDTYMAGYLYCRALGFSVERAGRFAAAMCTLKLQKSGPFDASIEEVERLIASKN